MRILSAIAIASAVGLWGCSTDSPTEPSQTPQPPTNPPAATWTITVTASPNQIAAGSTDAIAVRVTVRRADNGQAPPNGTTLGVAATGGSFNSFGSGVQSLIASLVGGQVDLAYFAPLSEGVVTFTAQLENSIGQTQLTVAGIATFFLEAVLPNTGSPDGGETIRINGGGFKSPVRVTMGGLTASVTSVESSVIRAVTPAINLAAGQNQSVNVTVENAFGTPEAASDTLVGVFTYTRDSGPPTAMQIFSVSPGSGPNEGGTRVVITGEGFESPVQVLFGTGNTTSFNGVEASVESVTPTQVVAVAPAATGFGQGNRDSTVDVLVRNRNTGEAAIRTDSFQFGTAVLITSIAPSEGPATGGTRVTLFGQGFDEPVAVSFAGIGAARIISVTGTEIIAITDGVEIDDCQDVSGVAEVVNIETGAGDDSGPGWLYEVAEGPAITSVDPTTIPQAGGTQLRVRGRNFFEPLRLTLDGAVIAATIVSSTELRFTVPAIAQADLDTESCDDNEDEQDGERFLDTTVQLEIAVAHLSTGCEDTQSVNLIYQPADRTCRGDVAPPDPPDPVVPPVADFTFTIAGLQVAFDDASTGAVSWSWSFGDNTTSAQQNPLHTYAAGGTYLVRLTVTNSAGTDTITKQVTVEDPP